MGMSESGSGEPSSSNTNSDKDSSVGCPTCGESYKNQAGVKIHHNKIHGESIRGVTVECHICGSDVTRPRYIVEGHKRHFCSKECESEWRSEFQSGESSPSWKGGKIEKECELCDSVFKSREARNQRFCSDSCRAEWVGMQKRGENHPMWKGGVSNSPNRYYYGQNWPEQREKALIRDQHRCQRCRKTISDVGRSLDVHHIRKLRWFKENYDAPEWYEKANRLENLISFCRSCHMKWEGIPLRIDH